MMMVSEAEWLRWPQVLGSGLLEWIWVWGLEAGAARWMPRARKRECRVGWGRLGAVEMAEEIGVKEMPASL